MRIPHISLSPKTFYVAIGVTGFVASSVGTVVGYFVGKRGATKELSAKAEEQVAAEVEKTKDFYRKQMARQRVEPEQRAEELGVFKEAVKAMSHYQPEAKPPTDVNVVEEHNVFDDNPDPPETISENEFPKEPYVISDDDFNANLVEHDQVELIYYADDVLVDDQDAPVHLVEKSVGRESLEKFGFRSNNPNIVYVRNHALQTDFAIHKDRRKFSVHVVGAPDPEAEEPQPVRQIRQVNPDGRARERFERNAEPKRRVG